MGIHDKICGLLLKTMKLWKNLFSVNSFFLPAKTSTWLTILQRQYCRPNSMFCLLKDLTRILPISVVLEGTHPVNELYCVTVDKTCLELYWPKQALRVTSTKLLTRKQI